jgi:ketosteroid isomerase-like protein
MSLATTLDLEQLREAVARDATAALADALTDDVVWTEVDQRTPPSAPGVLHGRSAVIETIREAESRGLRTRIADGFVAGDRAAITIDCTYPSGEHVLTNAICELRDGKIARWDAVAAWDE